MDELDESQFDSLLFEGLDLGPELTPDDKVFLERFAEAKTLNLSYCNLRSIKNLPVIAGLERLNLSDNNLTGEDLHIIYQTYKKLKSLVLCNNGIRNLDYVALLAKISSLKTLDLSANPITDINNYRQNVFEKVPHLEGLDGYNIEGSDCSFEGVEDIRFDIDDFQDNEFQGQFYDNATNQLRKGEVAESGDEDCDVDDDGEEDGDEESSDESGSEGDTDEKKRDSG